MFRLTAAIILLTKTVQADYIFKTTFTAQNPAALDTFGSAVTVALNGSTLIAASGVPNIVTNPHVEIWKSTNKGQSWSISQSIACCPIPPSQTTSPFNVAFSDSGKTMLIGKPGSTGGTNSDGATLYIDSNGVYFSTSLDLTASNLPTDGMSVALSGDGSYAFVGAYDGTNGVVSYTNILGSPPIPKFFSVTALQPYSLATNTDGSTLVVGTGTKVLVYTAFSYTGSPATINQTILPTLGETNTFGLSVSMTRDGSVLAIGSCGYGVYIYLASNLFVTPSQILTLPNVTYFGCNVDLSDDGRKLIVGSQNAANQSNGFVYPYRGSEGVFFLENNQLSPPAQSTSYGGGGVSVINQALDYGIVLVGGPSSRAGPSGQIAVFDSVPTSSATPTATASATSSSSSSPSPSASNSAATSTIATATSSATATMTATSSASASMSSSPSSSASASATATMTATGTAISTKTSTSTASSTATSTSTKSATSSATSTVTSSASLIPTLTLTITETASPSASASTNASINSLAANSNLLGVTAGIAVSGGILGSLGVYFLINRLRRSPPLTNWFRRNNNIARPLPPTLPTEVTALSKARPNSAATIRKDPPGQLYAYSL